MHHPTVPAAAAAVAAGDLPHYRRDFYYCGDNFMDYAGDTGLSADHNRHTVCRLFSSASRAVGTAADAPYRPCHKRKDQTQKIGEAIFPSAVRTRDREYQARHAWRRIRPLAFPASAGLYKFPHRRNAHAKR